MPAASPVNLGLPHCGRQTDRGNDIIQTSMRSSAPDWVRHALTLGYRKMSEHNMKNNPMYRPLYEVDPQIAAAIDHETRRQHEGLELIASENFVSEAVLEAAGSVFTNKYAEGY